MTHSDVCRPEELTHRVSNRGLVPKKKKKKKKKKNRWF
jgi:hypothetical protein